MAVLVIILSGILRFYSKPHPDLIGKAERWSPFFPFAEKARAEALVTGLDDVRGLATDGSGNVFLAEANGSVAKYEAQGGFHESKRVFLDPQRMDQRGAAIFGNSLLLAQHGFGRVAVRWNPLDPSIEPQPGTEYLTGPSGIAYAGTTLFFTDDRPWPGTGEDPIFDSADYARWIDKATPRLFGAVYALAMDRRSSTPTRIGSRLRHPSGVAAEGSDGPLYVAESDSTEVHWTIFEKAKDGSWIQAGALGAAPAAGEVLPSFLGVALDDSLSFDNSRRFVFAAGPKSLYVFFTPIGMVGRIVFEEPVTGVACHGTEVYLMVGHRLCRLHMKRDPR